MWAVGSISIIEGNTALIVGDITFTMGNITITVGNNTDIKATEKTVDSYRGGGGGGGEKSDMTRQTVKSHKAVF